MDHLIQSFRNHGRSLLKDADGEENRHVEKTLGEEFTSPVRRLLTLSKSGGNERGKYMQIMRIALFVRSTKNQMPIFNSSLPLYRSKQRNEFSPIAIDLSDERGVEKPPSRWRLQKALVMP